MYFVDKGQYQKASKVARRIVERHQRQPWFHRASAEIDPRDGSVYVLVRILPRGMPTLPPVDDGIPIRVERITPGKVL
jgi:hypothetical protein